MKISELIGKLQDRKKHYGDLDVYVEDIEHKDIYIHTFVDEAIVLSNNTTV